jgi:hypothetical protein
MTHGEVTFFLTRASRRDYNRVMGAMDRVTEEERKYGRTAGGCYAAGTVIGELEIIRTRGWEQMIGRRKPEAA